MASAAKPRIRVNTRGEHTGVHIDGELVRPSQPTTGYMRGNASPFFFNWNPALRDQRDDVFVSYQQAAARAIDAIHNSGWISGAVEQAIASTNGTGLRLAARPDAAALGWDAQKAHEWSELVESRWAMWSSRPMECDAAGKMTMAQQTDAVLRAYFSHGEALALLPYVKRPESSRGTKVQLLPPHRLVQDTSALNRMFQGVIVDSYGLPIAYRIRNRTDLVEFSNYSNYVDIRARDMAGRPQVIHLFEGREGQMRGITPMVSALHTVKQYDQLSDATLQTALIQAIFAATITSEGPTEEVLRALQSPEEQSGTDTALSDLIGMQAAWYENTKIDLGGSSRIAHLFPGNKLDFKRSEHPNGTYESFAKFLLREIARALGMSFETMTGDYTGATYSSVRMSTSEIWPIILRRRSNICGRFLQMVYEAWLEEEIEAGTIPFDGGLMGFIAHRPAAVIANWRGPAKPQADDLKTAKAHEVYKNLRLMSDERIADDLGYDIADEYVRMGREVKLREQNNIPDPVPVQPDPEADALLRDDGSKKREAA